MKSFFLVGTMALTGVLALASFSLANEVQGRNGEKQAATAPAESTSFKLGRPHILQRLRGSRGDNAGQAGGPGNQPIRGRLRRLLHKQPQAPQQ
jgi:hypothetical protein